MDPVYFGKAADGRDAHLWRIANANGMTADITDVGACLVSLRVPDGTGSFVDVVLGYDGAAGYAVNAPNFGAVVGRHANRISGAEFDLNGTHYTLFANEKGNNNHSAPDFWHRRLWELVSAEPNRLELHLMSPEGDQGFPGSVDMHVTYTLTDANELQVSYDGTPSESTIVNLTQHSYFNLNGHASGTALDHTLQVFASERTLSRDDLVPTGEVVPAEGLFDLREGRTLRELVESGEPSIVVAKGVDHNFVLGYEQAAEPRSACKLTGDKTGISCSVYTDAPGIQFYSGNYIGAELGKGGVIYHDYDAVCMETQFFPDAPHHPNFPQPVFGPDKPYRSTTVFAFSA